MKRFLKPSKILMRLSKENQDRTKKRIDSGQVEIFSITKFYESMRGRDIRKPIFFEKELISEYRPIVHKTRGIGYTTALANIAYHQNCIIVVENHQHGFYLRDEIMCIASKDVNPNCWQKLLIKLGF